MAGSVAGVLRVIQIINSIGLDKGGAERLVRNLHIDLLDAGVDAHVLALEACETDGVPNATSLGLGTSYTPKGFGLIRAYLHKMQADDTIVHAHLFPTSAYIALLKHLRLTRAATVFTEHNTNNRRREKAWGPLLDRVIYAGYNKICCISDGTQKALLTTYPALEPKSCVVLNGATLRFDRMHERAAGDVPVILSVGSLNRRKNYPAALAALARLPHRNFRYEILGEGPDRAALERQADTLGLGDIVSFRGHVPEISDHLLRADIFLMPSLWEGFGLAAVEAMNAGLPVVASDVDGLTDVVGRDESCALLASATDPDGISRAVERLLSDPKLRLQMGGQGFERSKRFDKSAMMHAYLKAYSEVSASL